MVAALWEALIDSLKMAPFLLLTYIAIELAEYKYGEAMRARIKASGNAGPAVGAVMGAVPQCGFSVISSCLYSERAITLGTLLAVYLSTSDEAVPVILSRPGSAGLVFPLLLTKIIVGLVAGYVVDIVLTWTQRAGANNRISMGAEVSAGRDESPFTMLSMASAPAAGSSVDLIEKGCCCHTVAPARPGFQELVVHPLKHTAKVLFFILITSAVINVAIYKIGDRNLARLFLAHSLWQPVIAAFVGLIPNCAASVAITQAYLRGVLSFGSAIAGLSAGAGLGILVLLKENRDARDTFKVIGLLLGISMVAGIIIQSLVG